MQSSMDDGQIFSSSTLLSTYEQDGLEGGVLIGYLLTLDPMTGPTLAIPKVILPITLLHVRTSCETMVGVR
jgi:hypothetical protein